MSDKQPDLKAFAAKLAEIGESLRAVTVESPDRAEAIFHDLGGDFAALARLLGHETEESS